jgi:NADPH2:quinone reductase
MKALVLAGDGSAVVDRIPEPAGPHPNVQVRAAALNPIDLSVASGAFPGWPARPGTGLGVEGVGQTRDGTLVYFAWADPPYGAVAEAAPVDGTHFIPVPPGLDAPAAAALGISGITSWLALTNKGRLAPGETVLVLGASGATGRIASQLARELDAGIVLAATRSPLSSGELAAQGADANVTVDDLDGLDRTLASLAPDGVDLVVDFLWGPAIGAVIRSVKPHGRLVQVGNSAGPDATIPAPQFRNKDLTLTSLASLAMPATARMAAYAEVARIYLEGRLTVDIDTFALGAADAAWQRLAGHSSGRKLVVVNDEP